ncbi:MAG: LPS export ABC transporter permease LptF [Magnetococcales bacterium]|nr:LPS export ABC transporter permease LptF [Magnetococcales bacterium]
MNRLSRYLFTECAIALSSALLILTILIMLPRTLNLVDLWVNKGVSIGVLGQMILLLIPQFVVSALPMAALTGILLALGRLSQDSEMVVMKASGVSLYQMLRPIALLASICALAALLLETVWVPNSFHNFHKLRGALISSITLNLKPQTFSHVVDGLTMYINGHDQKTHTLSGLLIYDQRQEDKPITLVASSGKLHYLEDGSAALFLTDGSRHEQMKNGNYRQLKFATYDLKLGVSLGLGDDGRKRGIEEMTMSGLDGIIASPNKDKAHKALLEWHRRWAFPVATLLLGILALPLGVQQSHRSGRSYGLVAAILTLILHFFLLSLGESIASKGLISPILGYGIPTFLMTSLTMYILINTARGRQFKLAIMLVHFMASMPLKLLRPGSAIGKKR